MDENNLLLKIEFSQNLNSFEQALNVRVKTVIIDTGIIKVFYTNLSHHHLPSLHVGTSVDDVIGIK